MRTGEHLPQPTIQERVEVVKKHLRFSIEWKEGRKGIFEMRRHYSNYFKGIPNFKPFRSQLVELVDEQEIMDLLDTITVEYAEPAFAL